MIYAKKLTKDDPETAQVAEWLAKDEFHQSLGLTLDDLFAEGTEAALVCDERGPIMAVRFHTALRAAVQFNPDARLRNARAGKAVADWFSDLAKTKNANEVIVRPGGKAVQFVNKLGFKDFIGKFFSIKRG